MFKRSTCIEQIFKWIFSKTRRELLIDHDIHLIKHFLTFCLCHTFSSVYSYICINIQHFKHTRFVLFLKVFKCLQCYHHVFVLCRCLGYWNEMASVKGRIRRVTSVIQSISKEFLFFCYFDKMNDFKTCLRELKNSGSIVNIWTF